MDSKPTSGALIASSGPYIVCTNDELPVLQNLIGVGGGVDCEFWKAERVGLYLANLIFTIFTVPQCRFLRKLLALKTAKSKYK